MLFNRNLTDYISIIDYSCFSVEGGITGLGFLVLDSIESPHEVQMPGGTAKFTICNYVISQIFDLADQIKDAFVLNFF